MLSTMSSSQLDMWIAYYRLEPFGEYKEDYRAGTIAAAIYNVHRDTKKRKKPFKPEDFIPQRKKKRSWQEIQRDLLAAFPGKKRIDG